MFGDESQVLTLPFSITGLLAQAKKLLAETHRNVELEIVETFRFPGVNWGAEEDIIRGWVVRMTFYPKDRRRHSSEHTIGYGETQEQAIQEAMESLPMWAQVLTQK